MKWEPPVADDRDVPNWYTEAPRAISRWCYRHCVAGDFELTADELREVARYVAESAGDVLCHFERVMPDDDRARAAIEAAWEFINGAPRSRLQRVTAMNAHRAARAAPTESARLAAQAAGDAAAAAYLHPIAQDHQVGHILRAAANAARIAEIEAADDPDVGARFIDQARDGATPTLIAVLRRYPVARTGKSRSAQLMSALDASLRVRGCRP